MNGIPYLPLSEQRIPRFYTALGYILRMAAVFCGVLGLLVFYSDALRIGFSFWRLLIIALTAVVPVAVMSVSKRCFIAAASVSAAALTVFAIWSVKPLSLLRGAFYILRSSFSSQFTYGVFYDFDAESAAVEGGYSMFGASLLFDTALFMLALAASAVYVLCLCRRCHPLPAAVFTVAVISPVLLFNLSNQNAGFALIICFLASLAVTALSERPRGKLIPKKKAGVFEAACGGFTGAATLLVCGLLILLPAVYTAKPWWQMEGIYDYINSLRAGVFSLIADSSSGGDTIGFGGEAGTLSVDAIGRRSAAASARSFNGQVVLNVKSCSSLPVYLRGWIGSDYSNSVWSSPSNNDIAYYWSRFGSSFSSEQLSAGFFSQYIPESELLYNGRVVSADGVLTATPVDVEVVRSAGYLLYLPTRSDMSAGLLSKGGEAGEDYEEAWGNWWEGVIITNRYNFYKTYRTLCYILRVDADGFIDGIDGRAAAYLDSLDSDSRELLDKYTSYVYNVYLNVDEEDILDAYIDDHSLYADLSSLQSTHDAVISVIRSLAADCSYTLSPDSTLTGSGAVEDFLTVSREGYCVQFATSAALLLRRLGIPTRYCEGYIADGFVSKDNGATFSCDVRDNDAHSWIEVYMEPLGWVQYETTPAYYDAAYLPQAIAGNDGETAVEDSEENEPLSAGSDDVVKPDGGIVDEETRRAGISAASVLAAAFIVLAVIFIFRLIRFRRRCALLLSRAKGVYSSDAVIIADARSVSSLMLSSLACLRLKPEKGEQPSSFRGRIERTLYPDVPNGFGISMELIQRAEFSRSFGEDELHSLAASFDELQKRVKAALNPFTLLICRLARKIY